MWVEIDARCRKCPACLRQRQREWTARAVSETRSAARTWFGTMTLAPEFHFRAKLAACRHLAKNGLDFEALPDHEQFAERHKVISKEITKFVKRLRKSSGSPLRYLIVAEAHQSGLPHYHMLLHERDQSKPIPKREVEGQWRIGFSKWRLVPPSPEEKGPAFYVCKYLAKSSEARVRASVRYGSVLTNIELVGNPPILKPGGFGGFRAPAREQQTDDTRREPAARQEDTSDGEAFAIVANNGAQ